MTAPPPPTSELWIALAVSFAAFFLRARLMAAGGAFRVTSADDAAKSAPGFPKKKLEAFRRLRKFPEKALSAVHTGSLLLAIVGAPAAFVSAHEFVRLLAASLPALAERGGSLETVLTSALGFCLALSLAGVFDLLMSALAEAAPTRLAVSSAPMILFLERLFAPFAALFGALVRLSLRPFGIRPEFRPPRPSLEELERLLTEAVRHEKLSRQTPRLIHNIFEMSDRIARDIIVPRTQVVSIDIAAPPQQLVARLAEEGHSRLPVYRGDVDNIVGILHARDLIPMLSCPELIVIEDVIRPAMFVPWSKPVGDLLRVMQKKRVHMAIVVDEYGGFLGVVTLEDLLETIVGEIHSEYAIEGPADIEQISDGTLLVRGTAGVSEVEKRLGVRLAPEEPCETMSGLVSLLSGCIPEAGERLFIGGVLLTVEERTDRKVTRIRCQKVSSLPPESVQERNSPRVTANEPPQINT